MGAHPLSFSKLDFATTPFLVIWEVTRACALACRHCRAEADERRDPNELTLEQGKQLLDAVHGLGTPVCVLSGGDPLKRLDLAELVHYGASLGLRMASIPAATPALTYERLRELKQAGLAQIAFSLDGSTAAYHDDFRQVPGTFDRTLQGIAWAKELGLPLQINTTFARRNWHDVEGLFALVESLGIVFWEVFSMVPVGRGAELETLGAAEHDELFARLWQLSSRASFVIKVTEAPHYRRHVLEQRAKLRARGEASEAASQHPHARLAQLGGHGPGSPAGRPPHTLSSGSAIPAQLSRELSTADSFGAKAKGINSGKGFCFVSHVGDVYPSGFFPQAVGNVKSQALAELYRESPLMRELRDPSRLKGRCGRCEYADVCGGSRARALALFGDHLAEDPACSYDPPRARPPA
jgi:radical SAM protein with 4Fe4S-binding SPASM domain